MIYKRLLRNPDNENQSFLPTSVERNMVNASSKFWTPMKFSVIALIAGAALLWILAVIFSGITSSTLLFGGIILISGILSFKFIIFEEAYYKKELNLVKEHKDSTAAMNYGILYCNDREAGTSVGYIDGWIGCMISLERGSMVGQDDNYIERCYDIYSNFLKACNQNGYNVQICNTMEYASKDPRLVDLIQSTKNEMNPNLRKMLEYNANYIKLICDNSFYHNETILIYTKDFLKLNTIIEDAITLSSQLLQGAYLSRHIMNEEEIIKYHIELNNVVYFDINNAKAEIFDSIQKSNRKFELHSLSFKNGNELVLTPQQQRKIEELYNSWVHNKGMKIDLQKELLG